MSKFACIYFVDNKILLSKVNTISRFCGGLAIEECSYGTIEGYNVYVAQDKKLPSDRKWNKVEHQLIKRGVEYVAMDQAVCDYTFHTLRRTDGTHLRRLMAPHILQYIFKYNLAHCDEKYAKIGIIADKIEGTLDVIAGIMDVVTDLTLFTNDSEIYQEVIEEVYRLSRVKGKLMPPIKIKMQEMDILFDLTSGTHCYNWCQPKAVYVHLGNKEVVSKVKLNTVPPIIWSHFDILLEDREMTLSTLEAVLYADGFSKWLLRRKVREFPIRIHRTYSPREVDNMSPVGYNF